MSRCCDTGALSTCLIEPRDWHYNPLVDDDAIRGALSRLSVHLTGLGSNTASFEGVLTYLPISKTIGVTYNATHAGLYHLVVRYLDQEVAGSPYMVTVSPNSAYGPMSFISTDTFPLRNITVTFRTTAVDFWGNPLRVGGDNFFVKVVGPEVWLWSAFSVMVGKCGRGS